MEHLGYDSNIFQPKCGLNLVNITECPNKCCPPVLSQKRGDLPIHGMFALILEPKYLPCGADFRGIPQILGNLIRIV